MERCEFGKSALTFSHIAPLPCPPVRLSMDFLRLATFALAAFFVAAAGPADAQHFYQGKTLTIVVGYSAGGGYDINARLISRHIGRHIPGLQNVVVVNMPGAGSLRALEHIERHAPKDGTVIGLFDYTQITNSLLTPGKVPI